jgi:hypothetical protein
VISLAVVAVAAVVTGITTWRAYWRQLRKLPAIAARYRPRSAEVDVAVTAIIPYDSTVMIAIRHRCPPHDEVVLVVELGDEPLLLKQLEQWCGAATPLVMRERRSHQQVTMRDADSGIAVVMRTNLPGAAG